MNPQNQREERGRGREEGGEGGGKVGRERGESQNQRSFEKTIQFAITKQSKTKKQGRTQYIYLVIRFVIQKGL